MPQGRRQLQVYNQFDDCCFEGTYSNTYKEYVRESAAILGGSFDSIIDNTATQHIISEYALDRILNDIGSILNSDEIHDSRCQIRWAALRFVSFLQVFLRWLLPLRAVHMLHATVETGRITAHSIGDNPYDWEFVAPDCSTANPKHFSITQASDWDQINNPAYDVFCVQPGDYRSWNNGAVLSLSAKGTVSNPRWILLYDPNNPTGTQHPVHLDAAQQAIMPHFSINGGDYWYIYRMTVKGYSQNSGDVVGTNGIRFSHMLIEEGKKSAFPRVVGGDGNYIFQYIVQRNIEPGPRGTDRVGFYIESCDFQPCVIVRNEFINPAA